MEPAPDRRSAVVFLILVTIARLAATGSTLADEARPSPADLEFFEAKVRPVLAEHCLSCHGPEKQKSGLRLDSRSAALKGGASGPAIAPGDPGNSPLIEAVRQSGDLKMPPKGKLPEEAVAALTDWVKRGAAWPEAKAAPTLDPRATHWAFQPVRNPGPPAVKDAAWPKDPIDRFILARLEAKGLSPSRPADKATLIRRASFDLVGLPPSPEEVAGFVRDDSPDAFARVVDRLLASPHYGERWGRHWLDVARYGDTKGYVFTEDMEFHWAYTYRDWVVKALNADVPYDEFLVRQIAADRLVSGEDRRDLAALGFLTVGSQFMKNRQDVLDDRVDVTTRGLMALTVSCARCHDHKFDPIPTADYYSLYGVFDSTVDPSVPPLFEPPPQTAEYEAFSRDLAAREKALAAFVEEKHEELVRQTKTRMADFLLAAQATGRQPDTNEFMLIADKGDLNPVVLGRWRRFLKKTSEGADPVFGPWHALAKLPKDGFAEKAASTLSTLASDPKTPVNPVILRALTEAHPSSLAEAAEVYGRVLNANETIWQDYARRAVLNGSPATAHPDPAREELRQVFHGPNSPVFLPPRPNRGDLTLLPDRASQGKYRELLKDLEEFRIKGPARRPGPWRSRTRPTRSSRGSSAGATPATPEMPSLDGSSPSSPPASGSRSRTAPAAWSWPGRSPRRTTL